MMTDGEFPKRLLDDIYDAATDEALWSSVLIQVADLTKSQGGVIFGIELKKEAVNFKYNGRLSEDSLQTYAARHFQNPWSGYMTRQPAGVSVPSDHILPISELRKTEFYNEVLRPQGVARNLMTTLATKGDFFAVFNICRSEREGAFERDVLQTHERLFPHLRRSMLLAFRLEGYRALQRAQHRVLDQLSVGVILLDRGASVVFANAAARSLSADKGPLSLRNGKVATFSPLYTRRLDDLVHSALRGLPTATMSLPQPDDGRLLTILVSSVRGRDIDRLFDARLPDAAVMLFVIDPANRAGIPIAWVMDAYGLTQAEARVAVAASSGMTMPEAAVQLGLSVNTIKTHLRRVFDKTGTSRQAELARLMASLAMVRANGPISSEPSGR